MGEVVSLADHRRRVAHRGVMLPAPVVLTVAVSAWSFVVWGTAIAVAVHVWSAR